MPKLFAPRPVASVATGMRQRMPSWTVRGREPFGPGEVMMLRRVTTGGLS
jgi:hypothetical protein